MTRRPNNSTLEKCKIHDMVLVNCIDDLNNSLAFNKDHVLTRLGLTGIANAIYWDYIRHVIEDGMIFADTGKKVELLPVSAQFFKRRRKQNMSLNSLLAGPGGKATGFALATVDGGKIALATVTLRQNQLNGARSANRVRAENLAKFLEPEKNEVAKAIRGAVQPLLS